jgi:hypothetical protein
MRRFQNSDSITTTNPSQKAGWMRKVRRPAFSLFTFENKCPNVITYIQERKAHGQSNPCINDIIKAIRERNASAITKAYV